MSISHNFYKLTQLNISANDFTKIKHIKIQGDNYHIGFKLCEICINNHNLSIKDYIEIDPILEESQKEYLKTFYPCQYQRCLGAADAIGIKTGAPPFIFGLPYNLAPAPMCSTVYYPQSSTENNHNYLSRNFDFFTESFCDLVGIPSASDNEKPMMGDIYIIELHPTDGGYASLFVSSNDLLNCCYDGINSQGLTVALMSTSSLMSEPTPFAVGLNELQLMKFLLDTCANACEAKKALHMCQHYYAFTPCQFIIGDAQGTSFIYEISPGRNLKHFIDGALSPQVITNHSLIYSNTKGSNNVPITKIRGSSSARFERITEQLNKSEYTLEDIVATNQTVFAGQCKEAPASRVMERTLWHSVYDTQTLTLSISFYLGENETQSSTDIIRSKYFDFSLSQW